MTRYNLVFQGKILDEALLDEVRDNLARLFKADSRKIARLFSGRPVIIKKDLDPATVKKYLRLFEQAGAKARAVKITATPTSAIVFQEDQSSMAANHEPLTLAQANTGAFPASSAKVMEDVPDISHLSMSAPRTGSLEEFIPPVEAADIPDISGIKLAEQGVQDLSAQSHEPSPVEIPHTTELSLSAVGKDDLETSEKKAKPADIPDVSHLHLEKIEDNQKLWGKAVFKID